MVRTSLQLGGGIVFWSLTAHSDRGRLLAGWGALGLDRFVPDPRSSVAILKSALEQVYADANVLVRPLSSRTGWTVVRETRGQEGNGYENALVARICPTSGVVLFNQTTEETAKVLAAFSEHVGRVQAAQVSLALVKVVQSLGGIRLRPTGAVYWLPGDKLERWADASKAVELAAAGGVNSAYVVEHPLNAEAVRAVRDALVCEVRTETARIQREIAEGDLGDRALETRRQETAALHQKVRTYEELLGVAIDVLKDSADQAEQADAVAQLLQAAGPDTAADAQEVLAHVA
jgi:hypothetical protein